MNSESIAHPSRRIVRSILLAAVISLSISSTHAVVIPTVLVGTPGNAADPETHFGAVAYEYRIGTYEVTNEQYAEFLNAKAVSDPLFLYVPAMTTDARGGIVRTGVDGSYSYSAKPNMANKPVNYVDWYDTLRFTNWLHNGQANGDTETGAYTLLGGTAVPSNSSVITRTAGAIWFLPNEDEWYKAAYYDPTLDNGSGGYWDFPTRSNAIPAIATANSDGDISNPGSNVVNYGGGSDWNLQNGNVTTVGSAGPLSESFFGTSDQGGNLYEWNQSTPNHTERVVRGGSWFNSSIHMRDLWRIDEPAYSHHQVIGFRVAAIPEPTGYVLAAIGGIALLALGRRKPLNVSVSRQRRNSY